MSSQARTQFWETQIAEWQSSGQSGPAFCRSRELVYHQFVYWRKKLVTDSARVTPPSDGSGSGFARVTRMMESSVTQSESELTVSLPGGIAITGLHAGNVSLLGDILRQL